MQVKNNIMGFRDRAMVVVLYNVLFIPPLIAIDRLHMSEYHYTTTM